MYTGGKMKGYKRIYKAIPIYDTEDEIEDQDKDDYIIIDGDLYSKDWGRQ